MTPKLYYDAGRAYLELHAMRAPVGHWLPEWQDAPPERADAAVQDAIEWFELAHGCELLQLGRSGRHICIEDTPRNRKRYASLQRKAVAAARELWAGMREPAASEWPALEGWK